MGIAPTAPTFVNPEPVTTTTTATGVFCFVYSGPTTAVANFTTRFNSAIVAVNRLNLPDGAFSSWFAAAPSLSTITSLNNGDVICVSAPVGTSVFSALVPIKLTNPTVTSDGLQYIDTLVGTGPSPTIDQQVTVYYTGALAATGVIFDSTVGKAPATFAIKGVIPGLAEAIMGMKVGGKRTVYIPAALGYGASATVGGPVPPNADLVFDIELIAIK